MHDLPCQVIAGGKIVIPADLRRELGIDDGDSVVLERGPGGIGLRREDSRAAPMRVCEAFKDYKVDQFLRDRRADWGDETCRRCRCVARLSAGGTRRRVDGRRGGSLCLSGVGLAEVLTRSIDRGIAADDVPRAPQGPSDRALRCRAQRCGPAARRIVSRRYGLSLGERACLALAQRRVPPVLTADKTWAEIDHGLDIRLIR